MNILIGKYRFPREEERIFMFLDLQDSTTYAEKLKQQKEYYINKYGFYPEFKAGVNMGGVTIAEIGNINCVSTANKKAKVCKR
ncbi:MAG: hypothetical protein OQL19_11990 [Gammaproteobacteria bacterium]|nr:hypothetical protein [Gammaproteobacteria bacterium]